MNRIVWGSQARRFRVCFGIIPLILKQKPMGSQISSCCAQTVTALYIAATLRMILTGGDSCSAKRSSFLLTSGIPLRHSRALLHPVRPNSSRWSVFGRAGSSTNRLTFARRTSLNSPPQGGGGIGAPSAAGSCRRTRGRGRCGGRRRSAWAAPPPPPGPCPSSPPWRQPRARSPSHG